MVGPAAIGTVTLLAGDPSSTGLANGIGTNAKFNNPKGICYSKVNNLLYVADYGNNAIRKVVPGTGIGRRV